MLNAGAETGEMGDMLAGASQEEYEEMLGVVRAASMGSAFTRAAYVLLPTEIDAVFPPVNDVCVAL